MKRLTFFLTGFLGLLLNTALAADAPRGSLLELHSCELFAGGCVVSSEATQGGRQMLQVWDFTGGSFNGTELKGLQLAVLQSSPDNLAAAGSKSGEAVVYLPQSATPAQRNALLAWLKSSQKDFHPAKIETRIVPMQFTKSEKGYSFSAGETISVKTDSLESCPLGSCGDELWYKPRAATTAFTVAVNQSSQVAEPLLRLKWSDSGRRTVFLGRFGESTSAKDVYVTLGDLPEEPNATDTADGRGAPKAFARDRLARQICADRDHFAMGVTA